MAGDYMSDALGAAAMRLLELRLVKPVKINSPAAGADWIATVPGGVIWEVLSIKATLVTSAIVANRNAVLRVTDADTNVLYSIAPAASQAASSNFQYSWIQGLGTSLSSNGLQNPLPTPPVPLSNGFVVRAATTLLDVGDQWSGITLMVREWSETDVVQEMMEIDAQLSSLTEREVTGR
jgi:hypothetical protein